MSKNINIQNLYQIFFKKNLINISKYIEKSYIVPMQPNVLLTPNSKAIYDSTSPRSKPYILLDMLKNNDSILYKEQVDSEIDEDYIEKMENNGLGFYMESFLSMYAYCPVCGLQTLKKYSHSNVPVVDLICVNYKYHLQNSECFLYQVKISLGNIYFNLNNNKIAYKLYSNLRVISSSLNIK